MAAKFKMAAIDRFKDKNSINSCMRQYLIIKYRTKVNVWYQKASIKVETMVFNRVYSYESNMAGLTCVL